MLYPLTFQPIYKERIWGGRTLQSLYGRELPANTAIGESWEISDRPGDVSVIANGPLVGKDLRWLLENHRAELYGDQAPGGERFPLLIKILDARDTLSLQVHPPPEVAARFGGEPKTEMWYVTQAEPAAKLFAGLKKGVTREEFESKLSQGSVAECLHSLPVKADAAMFLPSGRLHAIGAGQVIFEIQQNSDTTYRVFDWNRVDAQGKPRALHVRESLASIDFNDFEPRLIGSIYSRSPSLAVRYLVDDPLFRVDAFKVRRDERFYLRNAGLYIIGMLRGRLRVRHGQHELVLVPGQFALLPASLGRTAFSAETKAEFLHVQLGTVHEAKAKSEI